jgi:hypothetical protein
MHANSHRVSSKLFSALFVTIFLLTAAPPALRIIAEIDSLLAHISLDLCEVGLAVLRVCGI